MWRRSVSLFSSNSFDDFESTCAISCGVSMYIYMLEDTVQRPTINNGKVTKTAQVPVESDPLDTELRFHVSCTSTVFYSSIFSSILYLSYSWCFIFRFVLTFQLVVVSSFIFKHKQTNMMRKSVFPLQG